VVGPPDVTEWLLAPVSGYPPVRAWFGLEEPRLELALGTAAFLSPFVDRARLAEVVGERLAGLRWPTGRHDQPAAAFFLAAQARMHDTVREIVASWPEDLYRGGQYLDYYARPQAIVFGLGSADEVRDAFERYELRIQRDWHVAGWLAHTGNDGVAFAEQRIAEIRNRVIRETAERVLERALS
jgi:hypothetical protein